MPTVAESIVTALADHGVTQVWGVVGDALNPVTEAIRQEDRIEWIGVRHEEAAAFAVSAQANASGFELWTTNSAGAACMKAGASW